MLHFKSNAIHKDLRAMGRFKEDGVQMKMHKKSISGKYMSNFNSSYATGRTRFNGWMVKELFIPFLASRWVGKCNSVEKRLGLCHFCGNIRKLNIIFSYQWLRHEGSYRQNQLFVNLSLPIRYFSTDS